MQLDVSFIRESIETATRTLLKNDLFLLANNSDEWSISHKFAEYLQHQFQDWHVDVEYNRDKDQVKELDEENVRPDIIVHIRDTSNNLLVVEIKKSNNLEWLDRDRRRLCKFTSLTGRYKYRFGALIVFHVAGEYQKLPVMELYQKGEQVPLE